MGAAADGCLLLRHQHSPPSAAAPLRGRCSSAPSTCAPPPMPSRYVTATTLAPAPRPSRNSPTNPNPSTPGIRGGVAKLGHSNRDPGQRVANPSHIEQFTRAYTAAGRSLASIRGNAPSTTDRNTNTLVDLCLSYHLHGGCYSNCQRSSTHKPLTAPER